jgi:serine protease AprX
VVVAGNDGVTRTRLSMPAATPYVLAVGAADSDGTGGEADDLIEASAPAATVPDTRT